MLLITRLLNLIFFCLALTACKQKSATLFNKISSSHSGINFNNIVEENDSINPIDLEFLYNGGGVAAGDFNNDSLPDLYFTASTTSSVLYLNKGNLQFTDVTDAAGVSTKGKWCNGASVVDINADGWLDIYVSNSISKNAEQRKNQLFINKGVGADGIPHFKDEAAAYGLADTSFSVQSAFFDYDRDGDLDMYLLTTQLAQRNAPRFSDNNIDTAATDIDRLYKNRWDSALGHAVFTDVSKEAGIAEKGYGLGLAITDINNDGWPDIHVTNDFLTSDLLYINNKNGTFTNKVREVFKHTSYNAMGTDVADINNDGLQDIITVDMNPEDNLRKKKNMGAGNYFAYQRMQYGDMTLQYVRNSLQLNLGPHSTGSDSVNLPQFADIAFAAGVAETDWSWSALLADFNLDGYRDLFITNGYPKDVTDRDFATFRLRNEGAVDKKELLKQIPQIKIANYAYCNQNGYEFRDSSAAWGMNEPSFSAGAAAVDLDRDGDLDYVVNNTNEPAFLYENKSAHTKKFHWLTVQVTDSGANRNAVGAQLKIYYKGGQQFWEANPTRGYLSCMEAIAHFGLGTTSIVDSIVVLWPDGSRQTERSMNSNQHLVITHKKNSAATKTQPVLSGAQNLLFQNITAAWGLQYNHQEPDFIDFNRERLLPHKFSQYGPSLAVADVDGNGWDDVVMGTLDVQGIPMFLQSGDGKFRKQHISTPTQQSGAEIRGILLFDADSDGDVDLYCAHGGNEAAAGSRAYQDQFFVNNGKGIFLTDTLALPRNNSSKSCVRAADIEGDGDLDLFVGGRVIPGKYPAPTASFIYRNDSKNGSIRFTDVTAQYAPGLQNIGLTCDALFTDFDNDNDPDLLLAGEWMSPQLFKNSGGKFENLTAVSGVQDHKGWWNSITAGDFDNDGDMDYVLGNLGTNSFFRASPQYPAQVYAADFDKNGSMDAIPVLYLKDENGKRQPFTAHTRDELVEQLPVLKKSNLKYSDFGGSTFDELFPASVLKKSLRLEANNFTTGYLQNNGGNFSFKALPAQAQWSTVFGTAAIDVNEDGNLDLVLAGNDHGAEITNGRQDAFNGWVFLGDGNGSFTAMPALQSGFYVSGDAKAMVTFIGPAQKEMVAASQNKGPVQLFQSNKISSIIPSLSTDCAVLYQLSNGKKRKAELYWGTSFLSQSGRYLTKPVGTQSAVAYNRKGEQRILIIK